MSNKLRVIIIDDLPSDRDELRDIIQYYHRDIAIVGEADNTKDGWKLIEQGGIDGVFLDINFPGKEEDQGIALAHSIRKLDNPPWIALMSAKDNFAIEANPVNPVYFIEKPVDKYRVKEVLDTVRLRHKSMES